MARIGRRTFLEGAAASLALGACAALEPPLADAVGDAPLRVRAARKGLYYGAAARTKDIADEAYAAAYAREAGMLVPNNQAKRHIIEAKRGRLDFGAADSLLEFAGRHGIAARGHTLVWHYNNPPWLDAALKDRPDEHLLTDYVTDVAGHFKGRMHSWDVVNEAVEPRHGRADGLRVTPWLEAFGPGFIDTAFHAAHAADPGALLVYNDYGIEMAGADPDARRRATLALLEGMRGRGVPVGALGLQAHLRAFSQRFDASALERFLAAVAGIGLKIMVTELDVVDRGGPTDIPSRDRAVADLTRRLLDVVLSRPEAVAVLTWGLSDRDLWLGARPYARWPDGQVSRMLPLDTEFARKPMWHAMARAFDGAPARPPA